MAYFYFRIKQFNYNYKNFLYKNNLNRHNQKYNINKHNLSVRVFFLKYKYKSTIIYYSIAVFHKIKRINIHIKMIKYINT